MFDFSTNAAQYCICCLLNKYGNTAPAHKPTDTKSRVIPTTPTEGIHIFVAMTFTLLSLVMHKHTQHGNAGSHTVPIRKTLTAIHEYIIFYNATSHHTQRGNSGQQIPFFLPYNVDLLTHNLRYQQLKVSKWGYSKWNAGLSPGTLREVTKVHTGRLRKYKERKIQWRRQLHNTFKQSESAWMET